MEAAEAKVQKILEGNKQFLVPHFQRPYSWREPQWKALWNDLIELTENPESKPHFLGSIVTSPARSIPEGVEKRLLIDGQQRLTTITLLLVLIRDRAREGGLNKVADRIDDLVTNRHDEGAEHFKLLPTQAEDPNESDREAFIRIVQGLPLDTGSGLGAACSFFKTKMRRSDAPDLDALFRVITSKLTLVSIILSEQDNPHRIFESLNGKGRPLSQADLIRNYFFMRLDPREHERVYFDIWRPIQRRLSEDVLTDFVRHYLAMHGALVRETDVYTALKARVDDDKASGPLEHLKDLAGYSEHYEVLLKPEKARSGPARERLRRIERLDVTVAFPFLMGVYGDYAAGKLSETDLCDALDAVENFIVRRHVCGVPPNSLGKFFAGLYRSAKLEAPFVQRVRTVLAANPRNYPRDAEFRERLSTAKMYGGSERGEKTKFILERLEGALGHKERVSPENLTIEHVMPQTLTDAWKTEIGEDWEEDHEQLLHTLGNLTLTSYNAELSNAPFADKQKRFQESHIELNRHFSKVTRWCAPEIERRAEVLTDLALATWPALGGPDPAERETEADSPGVTGSIPRSVRVRGLEVTTQSWVDVAVATAEGILQMGEEEFARASEELPKFLNFDATAFRRSSRLRKLSNGAYLETNLSASAIHRLCSQAVQLAGLGPEDWQVRYDVDVVEEVEITTAPSALRRAQFEFWCGVRDALLATNRVRQMGRPQERYDFPVSFGRAGVVMRLTISTYTNSAAVVVVVPSQQSDRVLPLLLAEKGAIEKELGTSLAWSVGEEKKNKTISVTHPGRILQREEWPAMTEWLTKTAMAVHDAFASRIARATSSV